VEERAGELWLTDVDGQRSCSLGKDADALVSKIRKELELGSEKDTACRQ
jgi:hypothetical protein